MKGHERIWRLENLPVSYMLPSLYGCYVYSSIFLSYNKKIFLYKRNDNQIINEKVFEKFNEDWAVHKNELFYCNITIEDLITYIKHNERQLWTTISNPRFIKIIT